MFSALVNRLAVVGTGHLEKVRLEGGDQGHARAMGGPP
jgi:hypothetical protein